jgi:hypothetical protein
MENEKQVIALVMEGDKIEVRMKLDKINLNQISNLITQLELLKSKLLEAYSKGVNTSMQAGQ